MRLKGWGSPNSNEGTYTVVLYIYKYFVVDSFWILFAVEKKFLHVKKVLYNTIIFIHLSVFTSQNTTNLKADSMSPAHKIKYKYR